MNDEKNLIPYYRFPEFKNIGNWCKKELGAIAHFYKGKGLAKSDIVPDGNNYCIHYGELFTKYSEVIELPKSKTNLNDGFRSKKNDVLMPTSDVTPNGLAKASCINMDDVLLGSDILITRTKDSEFSGEFLSRQIRHLEKDVLKFVTGSTVYHLYASGISKLNITYPKELAEQQKIVACLSSLDNVIAGYEEKLAALEQHKKGLLQNLFPQEEETQSKYRFPEFVNDGDWDIVPFSKYITLLRGSSPRPIVDFQTTDKDAVNWIKIGDTRNAIGYRLKYAEERITHEGAKRSRPVVKGEIILANSMSYGKAYILELDGCIYDGWFVLRNYEDYFDKNYLIQLLNSDYLQDQYKKLAAGGIVQNISSEIVYNTELFYTNINEQKKIAEVLSSIDELIIAQREKIDALKEHKKGLMQGLFPKMGI